MNSPNTNDMTNRKHFHRKDKYCTSTINTITNTITTTITNTNTNTNHRVYPFVDTLVDSLYEQCDKLIDEHIQLESEKSIFMMFVIMYFAVHLKIKNNVFVMPEEERKQVIKQILSEFIRNPEKRTLCIRHFERQFRTLFDDNTIIPTINEAGPVDYIDFER
uniref:Uncharacterized protein n=1 Tax=viral metagenome TaxID=1070528 RepID=A0A6C0H6R5_9ZZZZ